LLLNESSPARRQFKAVLYNQGGLVKDYQWQQIPATCHGSSSTLTSAIASLRAQDCPPEAAVEQAQNYTWQAVSASRQLGLEKSTAHRFFWADKNIDEPSKMPSTNNTH
jgi:hydroxymethylpyrimidine/phosphomethylpyrimidine kinase